MGQGRIGQIQILRARFYGLHDLDDRVFERTGPLRDKPVASNNTNFAAAEFDRLSR